MGRGQFDFFDVLKIGACASCAWLLFTSQLVQAADVDCIPVYHEGDATRVGVPLPKILSSK
jgi:hypothetical protein